jgi:hypothetical protein
MKAFRPAVPVMLSAMALLLASGPALGVTTKTWKVSGREAFLSADLESLAVTSDGLVTLAPAFDEVKGMEAAYVWSLTAGRDGGIRAGTGSGGVVYAVTRDQARVLHDSPALSIESMAMGRDGTLYAGTAPDALILAIAADGTARTFADLPGRHVWGIQVDGSGRVVAATGDPATIYRIESGGQPTVLYEGTTTHFTSLALLGNTVLAGVDEEGLLYAIEGEGRVRVLMDAKEEEVKALAVTADGTVFAAVNPASGPAEPPSSGSASSSPAPRPAVYRIRPNGVVEPVWTSPDPNIQALVIGPEGTLLAATGAAEAGGIFRIEPDLLRWSLLGRPGPPQLLSLVSASDALWIGTGSPGRLYRGTLAGSPAGVLLSTVYDAKQVSDWGVLRWLTEGGPGDGVSFRTRTGNSSVPDATWSDWSSAVSDADGSSIASPPGRFIQWEGTFRRSSGATPALREVTVAFLEKNLAPVIRTLEVSPSGGNLARGGDGGGPQPVIQNLPGNVRAEFSLTNSFSRTAATDDEAAWMRRYRTVRWEASDPNDDPLLYRVEHRGQGENAWRLVKEDLKDPLYVWDTAQVPDGSYKIRVVASDAPQNAPFESRTAEMESDYFTVDNTAPVVDGLTARLEGGKLKVTARVSDAVGPLKRAEVSVDGGDWEIVHPVDRIFDQKTEEVSVDVEVKGDGEHLVILRAVDATGNIGLGRASTR